MEIKDEKKLITLKDAAKISGYSSDYIGQLIRAGKIPGKQIYTNITWVTTAEAVMEYKDKKQTETGDGPKAKFHTQLRKINLQLNILKLFFQTFKTAIPLLAVLFLSFLIIGVFLVQAFSPAAQNFSQQAEPVVNAQPLSF